MCLSVFDSGKNPFPGNVWELNYTFRLFKFVSTWLKSGLLIFFWKLVGIKSFVFLGLQSSSTTALLSKYFLLIENRYRSNSLSLFLPSVLDLACVLDWSRGITYFCLEIFFFFILLNFIGIPYKYFKALKVNFTQIYLFIHQFANWKLTSDALISYKIDDIISIVIVNLIYYKNCLWTKYCYQKKNKLCNSGSNISIATT